MKLYTINDILMASTLSFASASIIFIAVAVQLDSRQLKQDLITAKKGYYIVNPETGSTTFTNTSGIDLKGL